MISTSFHVSFRFEQSELAELDYIVNWELQKGPVLYPSAKANRTSVLKALIARERLRLEEEEEAVARRIEEVKANGRKLLDDMASNAESPRERKSRLQRQRRANKAKVTA